MVEKQPYKIEEVLPVALSLVVTGIKYSEALKNPNRKKIIEILEKNAPLNILDISKKLDISYKSTYMNIQKLEKEGIVELSKNPLASGQAVSVSLTPLPQGLTSETLKIILKQLKK